MRSQGKDAIEGNNTLALSDSGFKMKKFILGRAGCWALLKSYRTYNEEIFHRVNRPTLNPWLINVLFAAGKVIEMVFDVPENY